MENKTFSRKEAV